MNLRTSESIYGALVERIVAGKLAPGEPLVEQALATEFGVSRTPVREALHRLEQANLTERGTRRAFFVRRMKAGDLAELFEAVGEVESALAALSALRMSEIDRRKLWVFIQEGEQYGNDAQQYAEVNLRFHGLIGAAAHNAVLAATLRDLELRTQAWRTANFQGNSSRLETSRKEHRAIAEAILDRDAEKTRTLVRGHVASSYVVLSDILARRDTTRSGIDGLS